MANIRIGANRPAIPNKTRRLVVGILQVDTSGPSFQSLVNQTRLHLVRDAVLDLNRRVTNTGQDLGIFAAPEYLFSNKDSNQPIGQANSGKYYGRGISEVQKESNLVEFKKWSDQFRKLILIPGTMAWLKPFDRSSGIDRHKGKGSLVTRQAKALNATKAARDEALVDGYQGGFVGGTGYGTREVPRTRHKQAVIAFGAQSANILRNSLYVLASGDIQHKYNKIADYHEVLNMEDQPSVFVPGDRNRQTFDLLGKQFCFEICLDHAYDMLGFGNPNRLPPNAGDIHVLLSASVATVPFSIGEGGVFIHASSDPYETSVWKRTNGIDLVLNKITGTVPIGTINGESVFMNYFETTIEMDRLPG